MTRLKRLRKVSLRNAIEIGLVEIPPDLLDKEWADELVSICRKQKLDETQDDVLELFRCLAFYYTEEKREGGLTPKDARRLAHKLERAVANVREILGMGLISPFSAEDLSETLTPLEDLAANVRRRANSDRVQLEHECRVELAHQFLDAFEAKGWDMRTGEGSFMWSCYSAVLEGLGESHARPELLFAEAKKQRDLAH